MFEWTVNLGNLLTIGGFVFSGFVFVIMMRGDILVLGTRITAVEVALVKIADNQGAIAEHDGMLKVMDERVNAISRRLDEHLSIAARAQL